MSNHQTRTNSNTRFTKSYKFCGKGHKIKQDPAKYKTCNRCNKLSHFPVNVEPL